MMHKYFFRGITYLASLYFLLIFQFVAAQSMELQINSDVVYLTEEVFIAGGCFDVENAVVSGGVGSVGTFFGANQAIGINSGILLSTGSVLNAAGPNTQTNYTTNFNLQNADPDLEMIIGNPAIPIQDVTILEFDFTPTSNTVSFEYVFASEEYCDFVNTLYNDVFGFFISGPGINGPFSNGAENIALIPGTADFVAINNVNHITNSGYYIDNIPENDPQVNSCPGNYPNLAPVASELLEYDGFTNVLSAVAEVIPCQTYHIKLVVGDVTDGQYDSAVFLKANSFEAGETIIVEAIVPSTGTNQTFEGCEDPYFLFQRFGSDINNIMTIDFEIASSSTATPGQDFEALPLSVTFEPGQSTIVLPVHVFEDGFSEGQESLTLALESACSCNTTFSTLLIKDNQPLEGTLNSGDICEGEVITLDAAVSGGLPPYTFLWSNGSVNPGLTLIPESGENINVQVTDACGSIITLNSMIQTIPHPSVQFRDTFQICNDQNIAELPVYLQGNPPWDLTYSIDGAVQEPIVINQTPFMLPVLFPGNYLPVNLESYGCSGSLNGMATVIENDLLVTPSIQHISCSGETDGHIGLDISGGSPPYIIEWENGWSQEDRGDLQPGTYEVTILDNSGCTVESFFQITAPDPLDIDIWLQPVSCPGDVDGQINVQVSGGVPPFAYQLNDEEFQNDPIMEGLLAGEYELIVQDANGCQNQFQLEIEEPEALSATIEFEPPACMGMNSGFVQALPSGGAGNYGYSLNGSPFQSDPFFYALEAGPYTLEVSDENGCTFFHSFELNAPTPFAVDLNLNQPDCVSIPDGAIEVLVEGAVFPYFFSLNAAPPQTENYFEGLLPGNYQVLVEDQTGCEVEVSAILESLNTSTPEILGPLQICEGQTATLKAVGTFEQYYWSNGGVGDSILVLEGGHYEVTAVDTENCWSIADFWLEEIPVADIDIIGDTLLCPGETSILGLINDYEHVLWNDGSLADSIQVAQPGDYSVMVWDEFGCSAETSIEVSGVPVDSVAITGSLTFCEGGYTILNASGQFVEWIWNNGSQEPFIEVMYPGLYQVSVLDTHGCASSDTVIVVHSDILSPVITGNEGICLGDSMVLTLQQEFEFMEWSTGDTISNIVIHQPGFFAVTVSDGNECFGYDTMEVISYPEIEADINGDAAFCYQEEVALGLSAEFSEYFWSTGSMSAEVTLDQPGWYFVTVTDDNECMGIDSIFLEQLLPGVTEIHQEICTGETIGFNNLILGEEGIYFDTLFAEAQNGCDSLIVLTLEVIPTVVDTLFETIVEGDSIYFNNEWLTEPGVYEDTLIALATFCDSIVFLDLEVYPYFAVYDTVEWTICSGEEISFNGHIYQQAGQFRDTIHSHSALVPDTVFWITIDVVAPDLTLVIHEFCQGDSLFYQDLWHFEDKVFVDTLWTINGCDSIVITELRFAQLAVEIITAMPPLCFGDSSGVIEVDIVSSLSDYEILWNTGERQSLREHLPAGEYQFTVTNDYGCVEEKFVALSQPQQLKASLFTHVDCYNPGVAYLIVDPVSGGTAPYLYSVDGQSFQTDNWLPVSAPAVYEPVIEDANGCHLRMAPVFVDSLLTIEFDSTETYIHSRDSVQLSAFPNFEPAEILWSPANLLSCTDCLSPFAFPESTTTFSVAMQTIDGCWIEGNFTVFVDQTIDVYAPTAFSPNGDGINDYFLLFAGKKVSKIQQLEIFDRWGNQVYSQQNLAPNDEQAGWDGNFNGKPMDQGIFVFTAVVENPSGELLVLQGEFLLVRK